MTQENNSKEAVREMLRGIVKEEISKSKKPLWVMGAGATLLAMGAVTVFAVSRCLVGGLTTEPQSSPSPIVEKHHPLERMAGITTALMVMADDKIDAREVDFAMSILARRQEGQLGARPQFVTDGSAWLNSHLSMHYFDHALAYLQTGEVDHFNALSDDKPLFIRAINESSLLKRYASQQHAVYQLITMIQDDLDLSPDRNRQINGLTELWVESANNRQDADQQNQSAIYSARMDTILNTFKENPKTLP